MWFRLKVNEKMKKILKEICFYKLCILSIYMYIHIHIHIHTYACVGNFAQKITHCYLSRYFLCENIFEIIENDNNVLLHICICICITISIINNQLPYILLQLGCAHVLHPAGFTTFIHSKMSIHRA